jgi:hypothetical protein
MNPVTPMGKRYIHVCAGCECLFLAGRSDALTCSGACRVKAHRTGALAEVKASAKRFHINPGCILRARALSELCPDLEDVVMTGDKSLDDLTPEIMAAFTERVRQVLEASP